MSLAVKIAKNTAYLAVGKIFSTALSLIAVAWLLRYLSPDDYGRYVTALSFVLLFGTVTDFGLNLTTTQDISLPGVDVSKTMSSVFTLRCLANVALLALLPILLLVFPYEPVLKQAIMIASVVFFTNTLFQVLSSYFQKTLQSHKIALADLAGKIVLLLTTALAIWLHFSFLQIMLTLAASSIVQLWALVRFASREIKINFNFDWPVWQRIITKTWPIAVSVVFTTIYFKGDTIILSLVRPYAEVGIYGAAYKILEVLIALPILFMGLILPPLSESFAQADSARFKNIMQSSWDGLALVTLPMVLGVMALAGPIISFVAGAGYENAGAVLRVLIVATGIIFLGSLYTHAIVAINAQKAMVKYYIGIALLAVILYVLLIPLYSYYAAAGITVAAELAIALVAGYKVKKSSQLKLSWKTFNKALLASLIMAGILGLLPAWPVPILIFIGAVIYLGLMILFRALPYAAFGHWSAQ